jgi:hypothetical protein
VTTFASPYSVGSEYSLNQAWNIPGNAKVVYTITHPREDTLALTQGYGILNFVIRASANSQVWAHEVGHGRGIVGDYYGPDHRIMRQGNDTTQNTINSGERIEYRDGP